MVDGAVVVMGLPLHDGETGELVQSILRERAALHAELAALEGVVKSTGDAALVQRVSALRSAVGQQLTLLDGVLELVTLDEPR